MKTLKIEWKHLEKSGNTCSRCADTKNNLESIIAQIGRECENEGWEIVFTNTKLTENELSESNTILLNGIPIEEILQGAKSSESHCKSCGELTGNYSASCRTIEFEGQSHEGIPESMIRKAICKIAQCC